MAWLRSVRSTASTPLRLCRSGGVGTTLPAAGRGQISGAVRADAGVAVDASSMPAENSRLSWVAAQCTEPATLLPHRYGAVTVSTSGKPNSARACALVCDAQSAALSTRAAATAAPMCGRYIGSLRRAGGCGFRSRGSR